MVNTIEENLQMIDRFLNLQYNVDHLLMLMTLSYNFITLQQLGDFGYDSNNC
jgi:hypothetical protein